jgi:acyl-coenzyme A synthetase/AMP-(fatty) acid ligase/acyl carrier protein
MQFATVSTLAADLGNTAIFPALMTGASVHIIDQEVALDGARFTGYMREHAIDVLKIVPSHLNALLSPDVDADCLPRKAVVLGGEALPVGMAARLADTAAELSCINHYGPTETTIGALTFPIPAGYESGDAATIPIGRPITNVQAHVMSAGGMLAPVGVIGELFIGGAGVARGYLGQPAQTAERFVPDPYGPPGSRLYRTGDRVRRLADGCIEFLGRIDEQIKIRGFRIEPREIESVIASHPSVRAVTVQSYPDAAGDKRLVAYVVANDDTEEAGLRKHVRRTLPDYMLPAQFAFVASIPLTANGKIDRSALPEPGRHEMPDAYVAPRSVLEEELAEIWGVLLKRDRVGVDDNFFELGGHSLLATQLVSRIREAFHISLSLRSIFAAGTVAEIAVLVEEQLMEKIALLSDEEVDAMLNRIRRKDQEEDQVSA